MHDQYRSSPSSDLDIAPLQSVTVNEAGFAFVAAGTKSVLVFDLLLRKLKCKIPMPYSRNPVL